MVTVFVIVFAFVAMVVIFDTAVVYDEDDYVDVVVHGHIGSNQMNQNIEPKTFFQKGKPHYLAEIREC